jgi:hypothetical protein
MKTGSNAYATYVSEFRTLMREAKGMAVQDQISWFLEGLTHDMKSACKRQWDGKPWTSLNDLIEYGVGQNERINELTSATAVLNAAHVGYNAGYKSGRGRQHKTWERPRAPMKFNGGGRGGRHGGYGGRMDGRGNGGRDGGRFAGRFGRGIGRGGARGSGFKRPRDPSMCDYCNQHMGTLPFALHKLSCENYNNAKMAEFNAGNRG